ncbi:MAG TPA: DNA internalization-related competence protein ComEC/Rec2 [Burkholderiales bacterium]|nr:DNA internalization-related competence protein ComEC/Rec2 [Burkholderiales bacterium]
MTAALVSFAAGVLLLQLRPELPAIQWACLFPVLLAGLCWKRIPKPPLALAIGFLWALGMAHLRMADRLAPELEGRDLEVVGVVASLPSATERGVRFELEPESAPAPLPRRVLVSWYGEAEGAEPEAAVHAGERWRFTLRLRRPHGNLNPHGFDYEGWLLERGIGATGYVRPGAPPALLGSDPGFSSFVEGLREEIRDRFKRVLGETPASGILAALAVGDQRSISPEEWRLFNRTGVTHLMSISGLHVTLVSGLVAWLAAALWRRVPRLALALPARKAGAAAAILGALGYTLLAGCGVPAQRTFWMVTVVAAALWSGRIATPSRALAWALAVVLAFDPWAVLAPGFWLSFGAVALIFYVAQEGEPAWRQWIRVQWAVTVGLAPAALLLFSQVSLVGPLANAVAIPLVSVVVTPLALAAAALPWAAPLRLAAWLTGLLLQFLEWCASLPAALWQQHAPPLWAVLLALAGVAWLLAPRGTPWRAAGLALMLPAAALPPPAPAEGEAWIETLDVGQGLAVLVRTSRHVLLYDTGPAFGGGDSGERIIAPRLRAAGLSRLDAMVVTHDDMDHAGGAASTLAEFETGELLSSLPDSHPLLRAAPAARRCAAGETWDWDGVRFAFLHPAAGWAPPGRKVKANDLSCVLRVSAAGGGTALLAGDIEKPAEARLLAEATGALRADVLLVPHHGSRTSSSAAFLAAVHPAVGVVAAGYRNRFGHPSAEVLARYAALGTVVHRTDLEGAVTALLSAQGVRVLTERSARRRYWHDAAR